MPPSRASLPDWDALLSSAARLQSILPSAVLVGGTASAILAGHRMSSDHDPVLNDLATHYDDVLRALESVAGWRTARVRRPVLVLGNLDGIQTGVRQLIRDRPLETEQVVHQGRAITIPTLAEILRIKAVLILRRNAVRDYLDFAALADKLGADETVRALESFDALYPQPSGESALQQLLAQLADPLPYDLSEVRLSEYKGLTERWRDWNSARRVCLDRAAFLLRALHRRERPKKSAPRPGCGPPR